MVHADTSWGDDVDTAVVEPHIFTASPVQVNAPKRKKRKLPKERNFRLTPRDCAIALLLARHKYATTIQIARRMGTSPDAISHRLAKLRQRGYVDSFAGWTGCAKLWFVTAQGQKCLTESDLPLASTVAVAWGLMRHTLSLTDLGISLELAGYVVISEREIRAAATRKHRVGSVRKNVSDPYGLSVADPALRDGLARGLVVDGVTPNYAWDDKLTVGSQVRRSFTVPQKPKNGAVLNGAEIGHIPDMAIIRPSNPDGSSNSLAIEMEISGKMRKTYTEILENYMAHDGYSGVIFYATKNQVGRDISAAISATPGANQFAAVNKFTPIDASALPAPPPKREYYI